MEHKDHIGQELAVGDVVVMSMPGYSNIWLGTIVGFTPKKVRLEYESKWSYAGSMTMILVAPETLFKVKSTDLVEYLLTNDGKLAKKR